MKRMTKMGLNKARGDMYDFISHTRKILALIDGLKGAGIRVALKKNLTRLIGEVK